MVNTCFYSKWTLLFNQEKSESTPGETLFLQRIISNSTQLNKFLVISFIPYFYSILSNLPKIAHSWDSMLSNW